ncbi:hypothetical protein SAMN06269185_1047 [Natronoarchaeum philippinense]|uniref:Uncharacterized protein n=2 Tax=Natronoarchaeum philippinense TaxID=558529 RepID=A0A285N9X4_NATPI|nr:hypothetical protein SAMN06269185_1047 [Natronoarchaeum philippinense]
MLGVGGAGAGAAGFLRYDGDLQKARADILGYSDEGHHEFGFFTSKFESVKWKPDGTLVVTFENTERMNAIALYGPNQNAPDFVYSGEPPVYEDKMEIDVFGSLGSFDAVRSGTWRLVGYDIQLSDYSQDSQASLQDAAVSTAKFGVEPELEIVGGSVDKETGAASIEIENTGNAPASVQDLRIGDTENRVELTGIVPHGETATLETSAQPFKTDNCVEIPPSFDAEVRALPGTATSGTVNTEYDEPHRRCVISA